MYFMKLLGLRRRRIGGETEKGDLNVGNSREVTDMATGDLNDERGMVAQWAGQQDGATKILAVQDGDHSKALVDYAVKMAQKLDCEIIALDVSDEPLEYEGERKEREINRFRKRANRNAETFCLKAEAVGVTCHHVVRIGSQEEVIKTLSQEDRSIRYVLLKPAQEFVTADQRQARVPVVDLNCSNL